MGLVISKGLTLRKDFLWNETVWNPSMISTALWLDAADASTITQSSGAVSQWNDKSGNGRHVSQSTSAKRPTVASAELNGKDIIRFDPTGSPDRLATASALYTTASLGIYAVTANRNASGESAWAGQYLAGIAGRTLFYQNGISTRSAAIFTGANGIVFLGTANTNFHLFGYDINGVNAELFYEAVSRGTASNLPNQIANTPFALGDMSHDSVNIVAALDAAEIVCLSAPASTLNRQKLEGYLAHKWGLTANLPSDHPYKTVGPTP
jgi:hypothetical protein